MKILAFLVFGVGSILFVALVKRLTDFTEKHMETRWDEPLSWYIPLIHVLLFAMGMMGMLGIGVLFNIK
jgi:hypothetical protein